MPDPGGLRVAGGHRDAEQPACRRVVRQAQVLARGLARARRSCARPGGAGGDFDLRLAEALLDFAAPPFAAARTRRRLRAAPSRCRPRFSRCRKNSTLTLAMLATGYSGSSRGSVGQPPGGVWSGPVGGVCDVGPVAGSCRRAGALCVGPPTGAGDGATSQRPGTGPDQTPPGGWPTEPLEEPE